MNSQPESAISPAGESPRPHTTPTFRGRARSGHLLKSLAAALAAIAILLARPAFACGADDDLTLGGPVIQPNVVMIITDDQTWQQRHAMPQTLKWYSRQGTIWSNYFVSLPWCCPSRATMITGQYAKNHGVLTSTAPFGGYPVLDNTNTLPIWLQDAGYRTGYIGKYLNELPAGVVPPGYDDWQGINGTTKPYYGFQINDNATIVDYPIEEHQYLTDDLADRTVTAINEMAAAEQPFYLTVGVSAPHVTYNNAPPIPADRHLGDYDNVRMPRTPSFNEVDVSDKPASVRTLPSLTTKQINTIENRWRREMESLMAVDDLFMRTVDTLRASGELDNTLIVFVSDNGFMHGEHRIPIDKRVAYRESIHVPLMISGPGFPPGVVVKSTAANIDIAPTIVQATGATPRRVMDGVPLQTLADDPPEMLHRRILIERYDRDCYQGLASRQWWYVRYVTGEEELYSRAAQLENEIDWPERADVLAKLRKKLSSMTTGAPLDWCEH